MGGEGKGVCVCVHVCVCVCACVRACVHACVCNAETYMYTHTVLITDSCLSIMCPYLDVNVASFCSTSVQYSEKKNLKTWSLTPDSSW